jgi:carboxypeptidase C (cathepsin A)
LNDAQRFAAGPYASALGKGDSLTPQERQSLVKRVARYTGLDQSVVSFNDMRLKQPVFCRELLKSQRLMVGRLDSRFAGDELSQVQREGQFWDPSMAVIRPPFTATFNNYVRTDLGFNSDLEY